MCVCGGVGWGGGVGGGGGEMHANMGPPQSITLNFAMVINCLAFLPPPPHLREWSGYRRYLSASN